MPRRNLLKPMTFVPAALLLVLGVLIMQSCQHEPLIPPNTEDGGGGGGTVFVPPPDTSEVVVCDPDTVYFEQTVLPLMIAYCATTGCHNSITHEEGVRLYDYSHIHQQVNPGHSSSSDIIQSINQGGEDHMPPYNHTQLDAGMIADIATWINQGALNNSCEPSQCDTLNITYSGTIAPLLSNQCTGCHGGSSPDGGINLTSYSGAQAVAANGHLAGAMQHQYGFTPMPSSTSSLSQCHIDQVLIWIQQGAPNN
ncbi:MAG: hypothetical protein ABI432_02175 [Flavobacteriales bacterium]